MAWWLGHSFKGMNLATPFPTFAQCVVGQLAHGGGAKDSGDNASIIVEEPGTGHMHSALHNEPSPLWRWGTKWAVRAVSGRTRGLSYHCRRARSKTWTTKKGRRLWGKTPDKFGKESKNILMFWRKAKKSCSKAIINVDHMWLCEHSPFRKYAGYLEDFFIEQLWGSQLWDWFSKLPSFFFLSSFVLYGSVGKVFFRAVRVYIPGGKSPA